MLSTPPEKIKVVVIAGPTASGKSELAVRLAERFDGEIVNADSMQVYRRMDIGTAKASQELRERVPHHLIDVVDPDQLFSAATFRELAVPVIEDIHQRGKRVFICGGTGLYIKSLLQGIVDSPRGDDALRQELEALAELQGNEELLRQLSLVDPPTAARLHPNDRVRIVRALEVYRMTGRPISADRDEHGFGEECYESFKVGIDVGRQELYDRIEIRVDQMIGEGLVEEVRSLLAAGYGRELKSMRSLGYKEISAFLAGEYPLEEAVRLIKRDTRRYSKRQVTWFRYQEEINWFEYPINFARLCQCVMEFFA